MKANEIFVFSREQAMKFRPTKKTYVVRVLGNDNPYFSLDWINDENVVWVDEYFFEHVKFDQFQPMKLQIKQEISSGAVFNRRMANSLLGNFNEKFKDGMDLFVHCRYGMNRSAGIAGALNDLFDLGHDYLLMAYEKYDRYVYEKLLRTAYVNNLVDKDKNTEIAKRLGIDRF